MTKRAGVVALAAAVLAAALLGALAAAAGCGAPAAAPGLADGAPPADAPPGPEVVYVGAATDEALLRLLDSAPQDVSSRRLVIDSPAAGAALAADSPVAFAFHAAVAALPRAPRRLRLAEAPASPPAWRRVMRELGALLGPERAARAHGAPFNGSGFYLVVTDASARELLRVFTDQTSYTPDAARWAALAAAGQPLTLTITWAQFEENRIPEASGPFIGGALSLTIQ
jgi:hypothetical protein